jgi:repressor LexA
MEDPSDLTPRQVRIVRFIRATVEERGYPPTVREIGEAVGLTSSSSVHSQLANLERLGILRKDASKPRAIGLAPAETARVPEGERASGKLVGESQAELIPVVGRIAAGSPILAEENVEEHIPFPASFAGSGEHFALRVAGDSMTGAGILDGDMVVIRSQPQANDGDIVAAILPGPAEDEATVKRLGRVGGSPVLFPANDAYSPIPMDGGRIVGKVTAVLRKL